MNFPVNVDAKGKIGFTPVLNNDGFFEKKNSVTKEYGFLQAIPRGFTRTIDVLVMQIKQFKIIFNQKTKGYTTKVSGP